MTDTSPQAIAAYWHTQGQALTIHAGEIIARWGFEPATVNVLTTGALPTDAALCLSFDASLAQLSTLYGLGPAFAHFVQLGTDGGGNPLVLNTAAHDRVEWLDHENGFAAHYVNGSLHALAVSLVAYNRFVKDLLATRGEDAYMDADFTDEQLAALRQSLVDADAQAVTSGRFWQQALVV